ncbi:MAG: OmpA family protein [Bacteroidia bacterium]|nr:OmpA family protein [Bacteroidia bacterium]
MKRYVYTLVLAAGIAGVAQAQKSKIQYGNKLFDDFEYYESARVFDEVARKEIRRNNFNYDVLLKAAQSYRYSGNLEKAAYYYDLLESKGQLNEQNLPEYIRVLMTLGKYEKARDLSTKYAGSLSNSKTASALAKDPNYVASLKEDSARYTVKPFPYNSGVGDFAPALRNGDLYFSSSRKAVGFSATRYKWDNSYYVKLYTSRKKDNEMQAPQLIRKEFVTKYHDGPLSFSPDGNTAYLTRNVYARKGKTEVKRLGIFISEYKDGKWTEPKAFPYNSGEYNVGHAAVSPDGKTLIFASDKPGGYGGADLYASRLENGSWSTPVNLGKNVNSDGDELFPSVGGKGTLFFASDGFAGLGGLDLFSARSVKDGYAPAENMGYPLNTRFDDFSIAVNANEDGAWFASARNDFKDRIYQTTIREINIYLDGTLFDATTKEILPNTLVHIINEKTGEVIEVTTDSLGKYTAKLDKNADYRITAEKENYELVEEGKLTTRGVTEGKILPSDLYLRRSVMESEITFIDKKTQQPLAGVSGTITNKTNGKKIAYTTDANGKAKVKLETNSDYDLFARKKGYLDMNRKFSTDNELTAELDIDADMQPIEKNIKFEVRDIFYDYAKYTLRSESMSELDKLAGFLIENDNIRVELSSHTDSRGSDKSNQSLSQKRAQSCVDYLLSKGVSTSSIIAKGYGESQPVNRCKNGVECSEEEHQQNRRTEIKILEVK